MLKREVIIANKLGLHARAATKLATLAATFDANVTLEQGTKSASASSILGLLMLESGMGKTISVVSEGHDEQAAMDAVCQLIEDKFEESC